MRDESGSWGAKSLLLEQFLYPKGHHRTTFGFKPISMPPDPVLADISVTSLPTRG